MTTAQITFLAWTRTGLSIDLAGKDDAKATFLINNAVEISHKLRLFGPGDITGVSGSQIVRTYPLGGTGDFEPNYFPAIDFHRPDFPWLFSPVQPDGNKLTPWLCLLVVPQEKVTLIPEAGKTLPVLKCDKGLLPDLSKSWAWAHSQVPHNKDGGSVKELLAKDAWETVSRLLFPCPLEKETSYYACLVPTFLAGCQSGLGEEVTADLQTAAWDSSSSGEILLPVYYHWEFATGPGGDFVSLLKLLRFREFDPTTGRRKLTIPKDEDYGLPEGGTQELEGALRFPGPPPPPNTLPEDYLNTLKTLITIPPTSEKPLVGPPLYGSRYAGNTSLEAEGKEWLRDLNLDPRQRVAAGLGTSIIQIFQEDLMAEAWNQAAQVRKRNEEIRRQQLGQESNQLLLKRFGKELADITLRAKQGSSKGLTVPAMSQQLSFEGTKLPQVVPISVQLQPFFPTINRISRPRGPVARWYHFVTSTSNSIILETSKDISQPSLDVNGKPANSGSEVSEIQGQNFLGEKLFNAFQFNSSEIPTNVLPGFSGTLATTAGANLVPLPSLSGIIAEKVKETPVRPDFSLISFPTIPANAGGNTNVDSLDAESFRAAAAAYQTHLNPLAKVIGNIAISRSNLTFKLDLRETIISSEGIGSNPVLFYPKFERPMYEALRDLSQDLLLPGLESIPPNTVCLLETNPSFIEAFMVGLNHEMGRELLWRDYPVDLKGTYFRQFWNASSSSTESTMDIPEIREWKAKLGENQSVNFTKTQANLALLIRGDLLRRYPRTTVYAAKGELDQNGKLQPGLQEEKYPVTRGIILPDFTFLIFDLSEEDARGDNGQPGWFFIIQQQPVDTRFGVNEGKPAPDPKDFDNSAAFSKEHLRKRIRVAIPAGLLLPPAPPV